MRSPHQAVPRAPTAASHEPGPPLQIIPNCILPLPISAVAYTTGYATNSRKSKRANEATLSAQNHGPNTVVVTEGD